LNQTRANRSKTKVTSTGWVDDEGVFAAMDTGLGPEYRWSPNAKIDGGRLHYKDEWGKLKKMDTKVYDKR
jgi:hypothetical protein